MHIFLLTMLLGYSIPSFAAKKPPLPAKANTFSIVAIEGESDDKNSSIVTITLDKKPTWEDVKIEDHGTFLQLELPDTIVPNPGEFFEGNSPVILKIAAFQIKPTTAGIRLFVNEDALYVKQSSKVDILDSNVVLSLDTEKLSTLIAKDPKQVAMQPEQVKEVVENSTADNSLPAPATQLSEVIADAPTEAGASSSMQTKMVYAAIYCLILLLGLGAFYWLRPKLLRRKLPEEFDTVSMTTLSTHALSAKQKLQVIQVGGQQVLLAITPNNIQFLTNIERPQRPAAAIPQQSPDTSTTGGKAAEKTRPAQSESSAAPSPKNSS